MFIVVPDHVRFVCISDTHSKTDRIPDIPDGDVLIHAGDFTKICRRKEVKNFNDFLGEFNCQVAPQSSSANMDDSCARIVLH